LRTRVTPPHLPYEVEYLAAVTDVAAGAERTAPLPAHELQRLVGIDYIRDSHSRTFARESAYDSLPNTAATAGNDSDPSSVPRAHIASSGQ
jgi:hypothetical protein